jgi:hypothetical protein
VRCFRYPPTMLPIAMLVLDDAQVFAGLYPSHHRWLCEHAIAFQVSSYRWPEMLALFFHQVGSTICEVQVLLAEDHASQFSDLTGLQAS